MHSESNDMAGNFFESFEKLLAENDLRMQRVREKFLKPLPNTKYKMQNTKYQIAIPIQRQRNRQNTVKYKIQIKIEMQTCTEKYLEPIHKNTDKNTNTDLY